jgi:hypothetical protein
MEIDKSKERLEMARRMNLHPEMPETWPMDLIDRLIWVKNNRPLVDFELEFRDCVGPLMRSHDGR